LSVKCFWRKLLLLLIRKTNFSAEKFSCFRFSASD
jgi:hypothetical protein